MEGRRSEGSGRRFSFGEVLAACFYESDAKTRRVPFNCDVGGRVSLNVSGQPPPPTKQVLLNRIEGGVGQVH